MLHRFSDERLAKDTLFPEGEHAKSADIVCMQLLGQKLENAYKVLFSDDIKKAQKLLLLLFRPILAHFVVNMC